MLRSTILLSVAWHLRVIELGDGAWACRWSTTEFDRHENLDQAIAHLRTLSAEVGPSEVFVHYLDGAIVRRTRLTNSENAQLQDRPQRKRHMTPRGTGLH